MSSLLAFFFSFLSFIHKDLRVALVGPKVDLTYEYEVRNPYTVVPVLMHVTVLSCM